MSSQGNKLFYGDNLDVLRRHVKDESVDLVYLDPPFNSNANYNILFAARDGKKAAAQIQAFDDTWHWDEHAEATFDSTVKEGGSVANALLSFEQLLGGSDMLAYLSMMAPRLKELHRVLKDTGSLYLHCDPTASHYLKLLLDAVFGPIQFRSEIVWRRSGSHNSARRFGPIHDTILFYTKTDKYKWNRVYRPYFRGHVDSYFKKQDARGRYWTNALTGAGTRNGESGSTWRTYNPTAVGRHWAIPGVISEELGLGDELGTLEKLEALDAAGFIDHPEAGSNAMPTYRQYLHQSPGMPLQDIWCYQPHTRGVLSDSDECIDQDVRWLAKQGDPERLGYPTQKPKGLLERIIASSTDAGDVVLDPFCGCGSAIAAAQELGRQWVGIDITIHSVALIEKRLRDAFGNGVPFETRGMPTSIDEARELALRDKFQFQGWATYQLGAEGSSKKGADKGIDGRVYFKVDTGREFKLVVISVKGGKLKATDVRDLRGVVAREKAEIGVLVSLEKPTRQMKTEALSAGHLETPWGRHPRLQLITVDELLGGTRIDLPAVTGANQTYKQAPKHLKKVAEQRDAFDGS